MQHLEQTAAWGSTGRERAGLESIGLESIVETLAIQHGGGENLAELAHDARNMVTALGLYCDLLEEPGVLAPSHRHYGSELRLVAAASRLLVEKMVALDARNDARNDTRNGARIDASEISQRQESSRDNGLRLTKSSPAIAGPVEIRPRPVRPWEMLPAVPIDDLAGELAANRNLLAALAGPTIALTVDTEGGAQPVRLTGEDLTRVLVNLVKNAAQAMPAGGAIALTLCQRTAPLGNRETLLLSMEDSGPGIPPHALDKIFEAGFSTLSPPSASEGWPATHRGLGLSITRSIIEAAGGRIGACNGKHGGALLSIELPVRKC
jgi:signal transduction histidine kinase